MAHLHHLYLIRLIHSLSNHSVGETMDNWTAPKYNFMQHTIVLSGSQKFTRCIPLSKREAKIRNQADFLCSTSLLSIQENLGDKSGGV